MFSQLLSQPPVPLNQAKAGLKFTAAIENVVMRALSKEPAKRYPDVLAFAADFCQATVAKPEPDQSGFVSKLASIFRKRD
jgi:serine/threonine-protein kinase